MAEDLATTAAEVLESMGFTGWEIQARDDFDISLSHDLSHGLGFSLELLRPDLATAITDLEKVLRRCPEFPLVAAADAAVTKPHLALELRTLAQAFAWTNNCTKAIAMLLLDEGVLPESDFEFLCAWVGEGAPELSKVMGEHGGS